MHEQDDADQGDVVKDGEISGTIGADERVL
jgi:hypothetical protein